MALKFSTAATIPDASDLTIFSLEPKLIMSPTCSPREESRTITAKRGSLIIAPNLQMKRFYLSAHLDYPATN